MFIRNAWYVAAMPHEIDDKPLGRKSCGEPIVFFRGPDGAVAAVEDFCPHRGAPLSLGRVIEGKLVCGYHGLEMGCDGKTVAMPGQRVRGFPPIKAYPAVEKYGFVWVWPGVWPTSRSVVCRPARNAEPRWPVWWRAARRCGCWTNPTPVSTLPAATTWTPRCVPRCNRAPR